MEKWSVETQGMNRVLTHACDQARPNDTADILRQDIGGSYVRCERCGDKFLPPAEPGNPRLHLRLQSVEPALAVEPVLAVVRQPDPAPLVTR